jgi:tetratricopeptide (TPR) repeat protein
MAGGEVAGKQIAPGMQLDRIAAGRQYVFQADNLRQSLVRFAADEKARLEIERELNVLVQSAPPRTYFPEVAYWNPRIATDADGKAIVKIVMPDSSTKWQLVARGVTRETLCGSGKADVLAKHDFFVELLTPPTFMEGDRFHPLARVHCLTAYTGKIDVGLKGEGLATQKRTIDVDGTGVFDVEFDSIEIKEAGELALEVTAETQAEVPDATGRAGVSPASDVVTRAIPVRPWGMRIETHAAGVGMDTDFVEVELPKPPGEGGEYHDLRLTVAVGPGMQRWLVEEALEQGPRWEFIERGLKGWKATPPRTHADSASALLGCLYAADYLRATHGQDARATLVEGSGTADVRLLNDRAAGLIAQLLAAQNDDGGWPWCGKGSGSDPWMTSHVAWALGKARHDGHPIAEQPLKTLTAYLNKAFADARPTQTELKAVVLYGVSWVDQAEYAHANRLYRNRQSLSNAALGHLALTFVRLDRKSIAVELLGVLEHRMHEVRRGVKTCRMLSGEDSSAWMNSELEVTALALLAQLSVDPRAATVRPMVDYLVSAARADGWRPHKAKGTVIAALATYYGRAEQERADYTLAVSVNGRAVRKLTSDDAGSIRIDLDEADLEPGKQRVDFAFAGRGEYAYAVTLSGFSRKFPHPDSVSRDVLCVYGREVSPPPLEYKGRVVPAGFSVARDYRWFRNGTGNQPVGAVIPVGVRVRRYDRSENAAGDRDYVVVQEVIPAGCRLLTETINGNHLAYDYTDHVLTLYYGSRRDVDWLRYQMVASTPGTYRIPSTIARSLYRPSVMHLNLDDQILTVLPRGTKSPDEYRMTPDELYNFGRLYYDDDDYEAAAKFLTQLIEGKWVLKEGPYRESIRMLLTAALKRQDAEGTVNYFEILKEKYPDLLIPFARIVQVADAYARTGQHERAYLIYRATADASFVRDSSVGGVLQDEGRFLESIDFLEDLWREYPDTPQVESIYYALSQTLYARAENAGSVRPRRGSAEHGAGRVTRADIIGEAIRLLEAFLALYPESPIADEASYSLANAYLDLDDFKTVLDRTAESIELFPDSKWLDRYRYIQALAYFHLGDFEQARELAEQVAAATFRDEQGLVRPSPNKWLALYIIGQIHHAQNQTAKAIEYYKKVKSHFSDAAEAVGYFEHKFVELPEVTVFHPDADGFREAGEWAKRLRAAEQTGGGGAPAPPSAPAYRKPFVQLGYRNIKSAVLQVYRVDLMKLALIEKNLSQITSVNLAGVKPILEKTIALGDGHDYVDKSVQVELNVARPQREADATVGASANEQAGAYLVICRGDDLFSSGLVLITPLMLEVQEDLASQRVRVNVVDAIARSGLKNVHVKVIGTGMDRFVSGETDLRGVYVADAVGGYPTAIARDADGHFAFYRSEGALLAMARPADAQVEMPPDKQALQRTKAEYRKHLLMENTAIQESNTAKLKGMFKQQQKGVQVQQAE